MRIAKFNRCKNIAISLTPATLSDPVAIYEPSITDITSQLDPESKLVTVNCFIKSLRLYSAMKSLPEANLPSFDLADSDTDKLLKTLNIEWQSHRKQANLLVKINGEQWRTIHMISLLNPGGYPFRTHNLMDMLTDGIAYEMGLNGRLGIQMEDVGDGLLAPNDAVNLYGNITEEFVILEPDKPINISVVGGSTSGSSSGTGTGSTGSTTGGTGSTGTGTTGPGSSGSGTTGSTGGTTGSTGTGTSAYESLVISLNPSFYSLADNPTIPDTSRAANNPQTFTVEAWIKPNSIQAQTIIGFNASADGSSGTFDRSLRITTTGAIDFYTYGVPPVASADNLLSVGSSFHHVVAVVSISNCKLYLDGQLVATGNVNLSPYNGFWCIGKGVLNNPNFSGTINRIAVYPVDLTEVQVLANYNAGK